MRYFRAFYEITEDSPETRSLQPIHAQFNDKIFVLPYRRSGWAEEPREGFCTVLIAKDGSISKKRALKYIEQAMSTWGVESLVQTRIEECTLEECFMNDSRFYSGCSFDEDQVKRRLNLSNTYSFLSRTSAGFKEYMVNKPLDEEQALQLAAETDYETGLTSELNHIFMPANNASTPNPARDETLTDSEQEIISFAPISYIIEGDAPSDVDDVIDVLLGAMQSAGRLESGHVFALDIDNYLRWPSRDSDSEFNVYLNHQLIRAIEGNILIIRYGMYETARDYNVTAYRLLTRLLDLIESAQCKTQIIFSVPEGKKDMVMRLRKRYNKPIVLISKDAGTGLRNANYEKNLKQLKKMATASGRNVDDSMGVLLTKRMSGNRTTELEDVFEEWATYYDARLKFPQYSNVIDAAINLNGNDQQISASEKLDSLIGLESVKEHIRNIILRIEMGQHLLKRGLPRKPFSMHMAFLGSPGTGKTEVARLYAEILKDKGILSEGRLISVSGGAGFNVHKAFEAAEGSVLFVDEAYGMLGFPGMVTEFIAQMENNRSNTVVILAGYEGAMNALLDSNPGFRSRVQTTIKFPDYTPEELRQIFTFMCEQQSVVVTDDVEKAIRDMLERGGKRADQGNARFVRKLFEDAIGAQQIRLAKRFKKNPNLKMSLKELRTMTLEDIEAAIAEMGIIRKERIKSGREELEDLIGLEEVKKLVSARMDFAKVQKIKRDAGLKAPFIPMHMAFKGNPGTGKTEVARLIGRILYEEGVLSVGDFYECGRQDLVSPMVGGSAPMIEDLFQKARGSVIFIDEAYSLIDGAKGGPGDEAINALIDQMEKLRNEVVVILAGYTKEIDGLLSLNPGFKSRIKTQIEFPDYSADELLDILHHMTKKQGYVLGEGVDDKVHKMIEAAATDKEFGNARFVRNLFEDALVNQSVRLANGIDENGIAMTSKSGDVNDKAFIEELSTLLSEDFEWKPTATITTMGFAA